MPKETLLVRTLVELADSLVDDFDVVELLSLLADRCVEVLGVSAAGVMLAAPEGDLRVVASSSEAMRVVELFELQSDEGPCLDCWRSGEAVLLDEDLAVVGGRWPRFAPVAVEAGFRSAHALPMRLRGTVSAPSICSAQTRGPCPPRTWSPARRWPPWPPSPSSSSAWPPSPGS
jgi:GAF domain-containing protein